MSNEVEGALLEDFIAWREARATADPDLSAAAFLAEREHMDNRRRILDALGILERAEGIYSDDFMGDDGLLNADEMWKWIRTELSELRSTLVGARNIIVDQKLNGEVTVHFA
jgi:hypothetical protein